MARNELILKINICCTKWVLFFLTRKDVSTCIIYAYFVLYVYQVDTAMRCVYIYSHMCVCVHARAQVASILCFDKSNLSVVIIYAFVCVYVCIRVLNDFSSSACIRSHVLSYLDQKFEISPWNVWTLFFFFFCLVKKKEKKIERKKSNEYYTDLLIFQSNIYQQCPLVSSVCSFISLNDSVFFLFSIVFIFIFLLIFLFWIQCHVWQSHCLLFRYTSFSFPTSLIKKVEI